MPGCGARPTRSSTVGMTSTVETCAPLRPRSPQGVRTIERHVLGGVVDEEGVRVLAVLAEALAVVGEEDEDRAVPDPRALQPRDEAPHDLVGVGDLAEVRLARVAREERLRRLVGRVGVVEVDPGEELLRLHALEPREGEVHHLVALLLDGAEVHDLVLREVEVVGVVVEALVEAPARVEHPGADEGAGRVAAPSFIRSASVVVFSSTKKPPLSRTPWCGGMSPVKIDVCEGSVSGAVEVACSKRTPSAATASMFGVSMPAEAVAAEAVGAQGVERDDDDVEVGGRGPPRREPRAGVRVGLRRARAQEEERPDHRARARAAAASHSRRRPVSRS